MQPIIAQAGTPAPETPRLDWPPMPGLPCRMTSAPGAIGFVGQADDGTWLPVVSFRTGPLWVGEPAVARYGAQRLAERVIQPACRT
jgi:hypothetical protein